MTEPALSKSAQALLDAAGRSDTGETTERVAALFAARGVPVFPAVVAAFARFGGYTLPDRGEGRFKLLRAKDALRRLKKGDGEAVDDPARFRIVFGDSEEIQAPFRLDGHGAVYEDDRRVAGSLVQWLDQYAS